MMSELYPMADITAIKNLLTEKGWTLAIAESVTAGHLQAAMSQAENARRIFQGGMTVYNVGQKCRQLAVEPIHASECQGVSPRVARELATHIVRSFCSEVGISVTGYAAPVPEKNIASPFAFFCVYVDGRVVREGRLEGGSRPALEVQLFYMRRVLSELRLVLSEIITSY